MKINVSNKSLDMIVSQMDSTRKGLLMKDSSGQTQDMEQIRDKLN